MSDKVHLIISVEPIEGGHNLEAICGEVVPQAQAIPLTEFGQPTTIAFCKKCFGRQYFYVVATAQAVHDEFSG